MGLTHMRRKGEALFPEKESLETLEEIRREIGPYAFGAQFQQEPVPPDGATIRWEWFGVYEELPSRTELLLVVQSWDTAHSTEPGADFSVCTTCGVGKDESLYLLDVWRRQVDYPTLLGTARELKAKWKADYVVIEKAGVGYALLGDLWKEFRGTIRAYQPKVDKEIRFAAQSAKIESGLIHLPKEAAWLGPFKHELMAFPNGRHDDQVDSWPSFSTGRRALSPPIAPRPPFRA
jgi:predicted phage terminase large subunit-like protein